MLVNRIWDGIKDTRMVSAFIRTGFLRWCLTVFFCLAFVAFILSLQRQNSIPDRISTVRHLLQQAQPPLIHKRDVQNKHGPALDLPDKQRRVFDWTGFLLNENGIYKEVTAQVQTSLVHSFSPSIEIAVEKKFVDPAHQNVFFANSPAIKWHNGSLVLVCRIWLDKERYLTAGNYPMNDFPDNVLYTQTFDASLKPTSIGRLLGIPLSKKSEMGDGPIEPRLHRVQNRLFTTFNAAIMFPWKQKIDWTMIYDNDNDVTYVPDIKGGSPAVYETLSGVPRDKHWMALIQNEELYFVHNLDPLHIMKCSPEGQCDFVHKESHKPDFIYQSHPYIGRLRGGTPFEHYSGEYYITVAHNTLVKSLTHHRYYTSHLVVLSVKPYRIVYISDDIFVNEDIYKAAPQVRAVIKDGFIFPVSLLIEDRDSIVIGAHVNDHSSILLRLRGLQQLMNVVIEQDRQARPPKGPPVGAVRDFLRITIQNRTGIDILV